MAWTRRAFVLGGMAGAAAGAAGGIAGARALGPALPSTAGAGLLGAAAEGHGFLNDASLLSQTPVRSHTLILHPAGDEVLLFNLRRELDLARAEGRPVAAGAARHSMGGHAIPRDGRAVSFWGTTVEGDVAADVTANGGAGLMRAHAGARWRDAIRALDPLGLSPKVMQSNNDFGIGATFSVNAHGWATPHGPMGATAREANLLLADGRHVRIARDENAELFAAAMGGYGLVGILTDLVVEVAPNQLLEPRFARLPAADFAAAFGDAVRGVPLAYGRLDVDRGGMFEEALMVTFHPAEGEVPPVEGSGFLSRASRGIFRAQVGAEVAKGARWWMETRLQPRLAGPASRNTLLNEPVETLDDRDEARTDILHEYFLPPSAFAAWLREARRIVGGSYQELLNVTLRWVERDGESVLSYAPDGPRVAAVMLFSQEMTARAEADMARMTRALIDAALDGGGSYYLPYRPHATVAQFRRAYPRWEELVALKARVDPGLLFRNGFWDGYLADGARGARV